MKFAFNDEEMTSMLLSLVGRMNSINGLLDVKNMPDSFYSGYRKELIVVENMLERLFPGSVERMKASKVA